MNHKDMSYIGRKSRLLSMLIVTILAFSGFPSVVLAEELNAPSYYSVQSNLDYEITTNITSSWINHESIDLVLANTGSETIHNWYLTFYTLILSPLEHHQFAFEHRRFARSVPMT